MGPCGRSFGNRTRAMRDGTDQSQKLSSQDERCAPRRSCKLRAHLSFGDPRERLPIRILDMSSTGARVMGEADEQATMRWLTRWSNRRLALIIESEKSAVDCQVVWHRDSVVGLVFRSAFQRGPSDPAPVIPQPPTYTAKRRNRIVPQGLRKRP